ncbi:MAG: hypothetical protein RLZZ618_1014 [Pseudomonadota bacterium]|jgi:tRNA threonylcarbamoyladenosine biosynthesis protein TsaB
MSNLLAFDTSTELMGIALVTSSGREVIDAAGGAAASAQLIPSVLSLLDRAGLTLADVDAIAFGCGPGAFTGLRTACSVAQGLAFGAGKPVLPVDSLMLVAEDARLQHEGPAALWVAMDARMDEIYAAAFEWTGAAWQVTEAAALYAPETLSARWQATPPAWVAGSALAVFGERLALPTATRQTPQAVSRAQAVGRLAEQLWAQGRAVDAALALPVYVRDKVAQTTAEREAQRLAKEGVV